MSESNSVFKTVLAVGGAVLGFLFGELDGMLTATLTFIALDYVSGIIVAIVKKELSSKISFNGIMKKLLMLLILIAAHVLDEQVVSQMSESLSPAPLMTICELLFISNECISLLENASKLGVKLPQKLLDVLLQIKPIQMKKKDLDKADEDVVDSSEEPKTTTEPEENSEVNNDLKGDN